MTFIAKLQQFISWFSISIDLRQTILLRSCYGLRGVAIAEPTFNRLFRTGGGQNFERRNVERLKFRNFKVANIKITKDELFDSFIIE